MWLLFPIVVLFTLIYLKAIEMRGPKKVKEQDRISQYLKFAPHATIAFAGLIVVATIVFFQVLPKPSKTNSISYPNEFGDAFGGILNPLVAFLAAGLTFLAFWIQYDANKKQQKAQEQQRDDIKRERFESRFYEMLRLHKENVSEIDVGGKVNGRKAFMRMFYEFKFIYIAFYEVYFKNQQSFQFRCTPSQLLELAYKTFFHGIGANSDSKVLQMSEKKYHMLILAVHDYLSILESSNRLTVTFYIDGSTKRYDLKRIYKPFDGHETKLAHYYRHMYQMVKYVITEKDSLLSREERYGYLKMLRAQLSNHEHLMLYYNSFAYGRVWVDERLFSTWRMLRNIPLSETNFSKCPKERLLEENNDVVFWDEDGKLKLKLDNEVVFEWDDVDAGSKNG